MVRTPAAPIGIAPDGAGRDGDSSCYLLVLSCSRDRSAPDRAAELRHPLRPAPPRSAWLGGILTLSPSIASARWVNPLHLVSPLFGNPRSNSGEVDSATLRGGSC